MNSSYTHVIDRHCLIFSHSRDTLRAIFWFLVCLTLLLSMLQQLSAQDDTTENLSKQTIKGTVVNGVTREPVARALVFSADHRIATITDDQGHFELAVPQLNSGQGPEGTTRDVQIAITLSNYSGMLMASKPGFLNSQRNPMANQLTSNGKELTIAMVPEALIVGHVVLPPNTGDRIQVNLYKRIIQEGRAHWFSMGTQQSRSNGEFRFFDLEPGTYKLFTGEMTDRDPLTFVPGGPMYGYPPAYFAHALNFVTAQAIQLKAGMTFEAQLTPLRQRYYPIGLPITNGPHNGQVEVTVSAQGGKGPGYSLGYDYRHQKISGSLPNGNYVIEAFTEGENAASGSMNIEVKDGAVQGPGMTLAPNGSVHVNAKLELKTNPDTDPQAQGGGVVAFREMNQGQNLTAQLEPADEFNQGNRSETPQPPGSDAKSILFEHIRPGRYWVRIYSALGFAASVTAGNIDLLRQPLTVRAGANLTVDVIIRDNGGEIAGTVEGLKQETGTLYGAVGVRSGISISGFGSGLQALIYCVPLPDSTGQLREAWAGPDGKFNVLQVPPGTYRVLAFERPQDKFDYQNPTTMQAYEGKGQVVRVGAGQKEELKLQLISDSE